MAAHRVIIALDLDNFYVGVERLLDPSLVGRPIGIRQKGILATCSYEARARGVGKLMGLREAKDKCPEMVIVDGSDLTQYRIYSNRVFRLARTVLGAATPVEKLGMDELFVDTTALVRAHVASPARLDDAGKQRWMALEKDEGFWYEPATYASHVFPSASAASTATPTSTILTPPEAEQETQVASHLAAHLRSLVLSRIGLTSSAGVAPSKLMSKLLASVHKPADQTTLSATASVDDVHAFLDPLEIRKIPGFGSTIVGSLTPLLPPELDGSAPAKPTVGVVRASLALTDFHKIYTPRLAPFLHGLVAGVDDSAVVPSPDYPAQISTEDSFASTINHGGGMRWAELVGHLRRLLENLLRRLEAELALAPAAEERPRSTSISTDYKGKGPERTGGKLVWARYPQTLRLSLRRSWDAPASARASKSVPFPARAFSAARPVAERVTELLGGSGAKDGVGGVVGGLLRALLGKEWGKDGLHIYVINWAATSLSTSPPAAADRTLAAFLAPEAASSASSTTKPATRPIKRKFPADLDFEMLRGLPDDLREEVLQGYGMREADLVAAEDEAQVAKRVKRANGGTVADAVEVIDLTSEPEEDVETGEVWEMWPDDKFAGGFAEEAALEDAGGLGEARVRCPELGCDELVFPFALPAHRAFHSS